MLPLLFVLLYKAFYLFRWRPFADFQYHFNAFALTQIYGQSIKCSCRCTKAMLGWAWAEARSCGAGPGFCYSNTSLPLLSISVRLSNTKSIYLASPARP